MFSIKKRIQAKKISSCTLLNKKEVFEFSSVNKIVKISFLVYLFFLGLTGLVWSGEFTVFGPQDYKRETGEPVTVANNFSVLNPNTEFILRVYNGGLQDTPSELVSSSIIFINGKKVLGPEKFNQTVKFIEIPVSLQSNNTIETEVRGKPGGLLTVKIVGKDNIAPNIQIITPPNGSLTNINPYNIKLSFNDDISGVNPNSLKIFINEIDKTSNFNLTAGGLSGNASGMLLLSEGVNVIKASIFDFTGNTGSTALSFTVDTIPPEIFHLSPIDGAILSNSKPNITAEFSDNITGIDTSTVRIILDGVEVTSDSTITSTGFTYTPGVDLSDGSHTLTVEVKDKAGNPGTPAKTSFITDITPPDVRINSVISPVNNSSQIITGFYVEERIKAITVNGLSAAIDDIAKTYLQEITLSEGENNINVAATDTAGNTDSVLAAIILDTQPPQINIEGVVDDSFVNKDITPVITVTDTYPDIQTITLNGELYEIGTPVTAEGDYTLEVTAEDMAGNSSSKTLNFFIDKTIPLISISGISDGDSYDTEVLPEILVTDTNFDTQAVTLNGEPFESGTVVTDDGEYVLEVIAQDKAGNQTAQSITFTISRGGGLIPLPISPIIPIPTAGYVPPFSPNGDNNADTVTITYYLFEQDGSVTIKVYDINNNIVRILKNNLWETIGVYTVVWDGKDENGNILPDGIYPFEINAVDAEGNNVLNVQDTVTVDNHCIQLVEPSVESTLTGKVIFKVLPSVYLEQYSRYNIFFSCYRKRPEGIEWIWQNSASRQADGNRQVSWDTTTVDNGDYEISLTVNYESDIPPDLFSGPGRYESILGIKYTVDNGFIIGNVIDGPDAFSPNGDNNIDTMEINYLITKDAQVTIEVYDANNTLLRTLKDGILETRGNHTAVWDGRDQSENIVPEGTYTYKIDAIDDQGNQAVERQGTTTIDNHFMRIVEPQPGSSLAGEVCFKALPSAYIHDEEEVRCFYRQKASTQWTRIGDAGKQADGSWQITWDTTNIINGNYEIILYAQYVDLDNNYGRSETTLPLNYTVTNGITISNVFDVPDAFSPNGDKNADTAAINYLINREGLVTIKLYDVNNTLVRTLKDNLWETKGTHSAVWDGKDDSGVVLVDGIYTYKIDATDAQGNKASQREGTITLDNHFMRIFEPQPATLLSKEVTFKAIPSPYIHNENSIQFFYRAKRATAWIHLGWGRWPIEGSWDVCWDTTMVANGDYEIGISGYYYDLNNQRRDDFSVAGTYTVNNDFIITNVSDSPDAFSPNGDGRYDTTTINYLISQVGFVTIKLYDVNNNLIRTLKDNVSETAGEHTAVWDGKDGSGNLLNEGTYTYKIDAADAQRNITLQVQGTITIDNHFMQIVEPQAVTILAGEVSLKAIPSLFIHDEYYVDFYYRLKGKIDWVCIGRGIKTDDGSWKITWNTTTIANGDYEIMLTTSYKDLNNQWRGENTLPLSYTVDNNITISNLSDSPDAFSPNGDGMWDTATINYLITNDSSVSVKLYDASNNLVHSLKNNLLETKGSHTAVWDGRDDGRTVFVDGTYTYTIDAVDTQGLNAPQVSGTISIDNHFVRIVEPVEASTLMGKVTFTATPSPYIHDIHDFGYVFYYRLKGTTNWGYIPWLFLQGESSSKAIWDTKTVVNGEYEIKVNGWYRDLNNQRREDSIIGANYTVENEFSIINVSDAPDAFSPNGDGMWDTATINYLITNDSSVSVKLYDASNNLVHSLKNNLLETKGSHTAVWDGRDDGRTVFVDGTYTYTIDAVDTQGLNAPKVSGTISIDNHFVRIVEPDAGTTLTGEVTFRALPSEYMRFLRYVHFYYRLKGTSNWIDIDGICQPIDNSWRIIWDTTIIPNGDYEIRLRAWYIDLNGRTRGWWTSEYEYTLPLNYTVYNEGADIDNLTVTPNPFSPDESGTWIDSNTGEVFNDPGPNRILDDIAVISFTASDEGFFNIGIFDSNGQIVRQLVYQVLYPDLQTNQIEVQWDGRNNQGNFVKNGQYRLVVNAGSKEKEKSIIIGVNKKPFITNVKVNPNPFSPNGDGIHDTTNIFYHLSENSYVTVEVYQENTLLRKLIDNQLQTYGSYNHIWDGTDEQEIGLPKGRYTIKISAQAETGNLADPVFINVSISSLSNIYLSKSIINPYLAQTTTITYQLAREGILSMKIYKSQGSLVRNLFLNEFHSSGEYSWIWDGRDDNNHIVPDGLYYFIIEDSISGLPVVTYDPRGTGGRDISKSIIFSATKFDTLKNQFCVLTYELSQLAKINLKVRSYRHSCPVVRVIKYQELAGPGQHQAFWDGRDEAGNFVNYANFTFAIWGYTVDENSILIVGGMPELCNLSISPVCFSPYVNPYSADDLQHRSAISFDLSRDANVTINIYDTSGNLVRTLLDETFYNQGTNSVVWDGKDTQGRFIARGFYRIIIQARYEDNYSEPITLHSEIYY